MHFHAPKPLHGWREFLGEVGIIVAGVLIALGAEQLVEDLHWQHTTAAERRALDADVQDIWTALSSRRIIERCVDQKLGDLALILHRHQHGEPLNIIGPIGRPAVWTATQSALRMASSDGSLSHMSFNEKAAYFGVGVTYDTFAPMAQEERASWRTLQLLDDPSVLDDTDWRDLRRAYRQALDSNRTMKADLVFGTPGQWLTPFEHFARMPENKAAFTIPAVRDLCREAVNRTASS